MAVADQQLDSRLFRLPLEIRNRIYDFCLVLDHSDFGYTKRSLHVYFESGEYSKPLPPVMLACKRAYQEMRMQVHHESMLRVYIPEYSPSIGFAVHGILRYERLLKLYLLVSMEHPYWNRWLHFFEEVANRTSRLRELVIDWEPRQLRLSGSQAVLHEKKENHFLQIVGGLKELGMIRLHGDIPPHWTKKLEEMTTARIISYRLRWWKEPGRDW